MIYWTEPKKELALGAIARDIQYLEEDGWTIKYIIASEKLWEKIGHCIERAENNYDIDRLILTDAHKSRMTRAKHYAINLPIDKRAGDGLWYRFMVAKTDITDYRVL